MLVAAVFSVEACSGGFRDHADLLGLEGLHRTRAFLWPLGCARDRVVAKAEGVLAPRVLEDRVQDLAMNADRAGADGLAVERGQEGTNVLGRDRGELATAERTHDPRSSLLAATCLWRGEHRPVAIEGGGLGPLLELEVLQPDLDRVLEARLAHPRSDLLFGFDLLDHLAYHRIGGAPPGSALAVFSSRPLRPALARSPQPALPLRSRCVSPLHFVEGLVLVGARSGRRSLAD